MTFRISALFLALIFLAGCQTALGYQQRMNDWIGLSMSSFIQEWGPPDNVYEEKDGRRTISYNRASSVYVPGITTTTPVTTYHSGNVYAGAGSSAYVTGTSTTYLTQTGPGYTVNRNCTTIVNGNADGIITTWRSEGNNCVAKELSETEKKASWKRWKSNYDSIEQDRAKYFQNKKRKCQKGEEVRMLNKRDCDAWGGRRLY